MTGHALQPSRRQLTPSGIVTCLANLQGWILSGDGSAVVIEKTYAFDDFMQTMAFANAVAYLAQQLNHHPQLILNPQRCIVQYRTHDAGGLSPLDFECARRIDTLLA